MSSTTIRSATTREGEMRCYCLTHDQDTGEKVPFNVEKGSEGCLNITARRPHEFIDQTVFFEHERYEV